MKCKFNWLFIVSLLIFVGITAKLYYSNENLSKTINILEAKTDELKNAIYVKDNKINELNISLTDCKQDKSELESKITELNIKIRRLNDNGHIEFTPTLYEVRKFLERDDTDKHQYIEDEFVCVDFANMLVSRMRENGIYACVTSIWFEDGAHAIVSVDTIDYGLIYVEPQDDTIIYSLRVGDDYCDKVNWDCDWKVTRLIHCFAYS